MNSAGVPSQPPNDPPPSETAPHSAKRSRCWIWLRRLTALALLVVLVPYLYGRMTSPWHAVEVRQAAIPAAANGRVDSTSEQDRRPTLTIAAYNIAHGRGLAESNYTDESAQVRLDRLYAIADVLSAHDVAIAVLNEVDFDTSWSGRIDQAQLIAERAGMPHLAVVRNADVLLPGARMRFGNAVLSRFEILSAQVFDLPGYATHESALFGKKRGLLCELQIAPDRRLRVLAVHLEHRSETVRVAGAKSILQLAGDSDLPLVCAGDFNSAPVGFPEAETDATGVSALGLLADSQRFRLIPAAMPGPEALTFRADRPSCVLDWILVPPTWQVRDYRVLPLTHSDHRPVIGTFDLPE